MYHLYTKYHSSFWKYFKSLQKTYCKIKDLFITSSEKHFCQHYILFFAIRSPQVNIWQNQRYGT